MLHLSDCALQIIYLAFCDYDLCRHLWAHVKHGGFSYLIEKLGKIRQCQGCLPIQCSFETLATKLKALSHSFK